MPALVSSMLQDINFQDIEMLEPSDVEERIIQRLEALLEEGAGRGPNALERLSAEVEHLQGDVESLKDMLRAAMKRVAFLEAENERLHRTRG